MNSLKKTQEVIEERFAILQEATIKLKREFIGIDSVLLWEKINGPNDIITENGD